MAVDVPVVIIVVPPLSFGRPAAREGGEGRAGREIGVDEKIFSARSPFPIPHSPLVLRSLGEGGFPIPQNWGQTPR